jgi:hypothetical protein
MFLSGIVSIKVCAAVSAIGKIRIITIFTTL